MFKLIETFKMFTVGILEASRIVTGLRVGRRRNLLSVSGRDFLFSTRPRKSIGPTKLLLLNCYRRLISQT
jgi:hypothetical protein